MPYKDQDRRRLFLRNYQNVWLQQRRLDWIKENGPCACGSTRNLKVAHIERGMKTAAIWSRREEVRNAELAKCVVVCGHCFNTRSKEET